MDSQNQPPIYNGNSLEYLDQISPKKTAPTGFLNKKMIAIIGGIVFLFIIVIAITVGSKPAETPSGEILGYRINGLNELVAFSENNTVNNPNLSKVLAETKVIAISEQYQISTYITLPVIDNKTVVPADESVTQTIDSLNTAVASGNFNRSLADSLISQIEKIQTSLLDIRIEAKSQATINKIDEDVAQYESIIERLTNY